MTICEIQQNSDITYRLYDYGRPRELHLDQAMAAADLEAWNHPGARDRVNLADGWTRLASCRYFATDLLAAAGELRYQPDPSRFELLICLKGAGLLNGSPFAAGNVWLIPAGAAPLELTTPAVWRLLRTYVPSADS